MWKLKIILLVLMLFSIQHLLSETALIDSLQQELKKAKGEDRYEILHDLGWQYRNISTEKALEFENAAIGMANEWGDSLKVARSLYHLARINMKSDYGKAVKLAKRSIRMIEKLDESIVAKYYRNLGYIHEENCNYENASETYKTLISKYQSILDVQEQISFNDLISENYVRIGLYSEAYKFKYRNLKFVKVVGDNFLLADTYHNLGNISYYIGDYQTTSNMYNKVLSLIEQYKNDEKINNLNNYATLYLNIGLFNHARANYPTAIRYTIKAYRIFDKLNEIRKIDCLNLLSLIYTEIGNTKKSISYNIMAYDYIQQFDDYTKRNRINKFFSYDSYEFKEV